MCTNRSSSDPNVGFDGHSGPEQVLRVLTIFENDFDRDSLDDLHIISRGILRRQDAVTRSAGACDVQDVAVIIAAVGIHVNLHGLAGAHIFQLRFLEVGGHPDVLAVQRDDGHHLLAGHDVLARLDRSLSYDSADRRDNRGVLQIELSLLQNRGRPVRFRLRPHAHATAAPIFAAAESERIAIRPELA